MRKIIGKRIPISDNVWNKILEKFGTNLRYEVPNSEYPNPVIISTKWKVGKNINFAPWLFVFDSKDNTYEYTDHKYLETEFLSLLDSMKTSLDLKIRSKFPNLRMLEELDGSQIWYNNYPYDYIIKSIKFKDNRMYKFNDNEYWEEEFSKVLDLLVFV